MKKLILSLVVLLSAAAFMSCNLDPNAQHCYEVTTTINEPGSTTPQQVTTQYVWGTQTELGETMNSIVEQMRVAGVMDYRIEFKRTNKSQANCQ